MDVLSSRQEYGVSCVEAFSAKSDRGYLKISCTICNIVQNRFTRMPGLHYFTNIPVQQSKSALDCWIEGHRNARDPVHSRACLDYPGCPSALIWNNVNRA